MKHTAVHFVLSKQKIYTQLAHILSERRLRDTRDSKPLSNHIYFFYNVLFTPRTSLSRIKFVYVNIFFCISDIYVAANQDIKNSAFIIAVIKSGCRTW